MYDVGGNLPGSITHFMDLLSEVDSKLFAKCKSEGHCLYDMLPPTAPCHPSSHIMVLRPRGHDCDVPRITYEATKRSSMMHC